jgi:hypothetical protein
MIRPSVWVVMPYLDIASEAMRIKTALQLNDWACTGY